MDCVALKLETLNFLWQHTNQIKLENSRELLYSLKGNAVYQVSLVTVTPTASCSMQMLHQIHIQPMLNRASQRLTQTHMYISPREPEL